MKRFSFHAILIASLLVPDTGFGQLWKQYADSAKIYGDSKNYGAAITLYLKAKEEIKTDSLTSRSEAILCTKLGDIYINSQQYKDAEQCFNEAKQIIEKLFGKQSAEYASCTNNLGRLSLITSDYRTAELLFLETQQIRKIVFGSTHLEYAAICNNLGSTYFRLAQYDKAITMLTEAKNIRLERLGKTHADYASSCNNLASLYSTLGEYEKAEPLLIEAKNIRGQNGHDNADYASSCTNLAVLYLYKGDYQKAEDLCLEGMRIREKVLTKMHPEYAISCNNLANIYIERAQYQKAEKLYLEARQIREKIFGKNNPDYAASCNNLANVYQGMGLYEKSVPLYEEAIKIWAVRPGKTNPLYATACDNLAITYMYMGFFQKAELLYLEAMKIRGTMKTQVNIDYATSCHNLAILNIYLGQYEKAEKLYLEALRIKKSLVTESHQEYAKSCDNLASLYMDLHQYKKAEPLLLKARKIREEKLTRAHPEYASSCENLGNFYADLKKYDQSRALLLEALEVQAKSVGKQHPDYASGCSNLAGLYIDMKQYSKAEPLLIESLKIKEQVLGTEHPSYGLNCMNLAKLYWKIKNYEKANEFFVKAFDVQNFQVNRIFQFTSEIEKQSYLKKFSSFKDYFLSFTTSMNHRFQQGFGYDVALSNRNLILASSRQLRNSGGNTGDSSVQATYNQWINLREQLSYWALKPVSKRAADLEQIEIQANTLEKELTQSLTLSGNAATKAGTSWNAVRDKLGNDEAAIEFVNFRFYNGDRWTDSVYYIAYLVRKGDEKPIEIRLFESRQLERLAGIGNTTNTVASMYRMVDNNPAYGLIWKPLEKYLNGIKKIYFAPAGLLYRISFHALPVNGHQVLSNRYQLAQLNTTASAGSNSNNLIDTTDKIFAVGGIVYDADSVAMKQAVGLQHSVDNNPFFTSRSKSRAASWRFLPGTEVEVDEIERLGKQQHYTITRLKGLQATEENIKALGGKNSPAIIHIATHGFFFPEPALNKEQQAKENIFSGSQFRNADNPLLRSGVLFAGANNAWKGKQIEGVEDGILTAYEVSNLYLPNTKLAVLSACETGLGDIRENEGVYGLQRAFKIAGVENLLMSLWKVPDQETAEFMSIFYRNIFYNKSIDEAFNQAQSVMRSKYKKQPFKWAAWVLVN